MVGAIFLGILLRMYTQNIDGLERKCGMSSKLLVEAHGTLETASCVKCSRLLSSSLLNSNKFFRQRIQIPTLISKRTNDKYIHFIFNTKVIITVFSTHPQNWTMDKIKEKRLPSCQRKRCSGYVKPDVVMFGEDLPRRFYQYPRDFAKCDLLIVMGTSLNVEPFSDLVDEVPRHIPRVLLNRNSVGPFSGKGRPNDMFIPGDITANIQTLLDLLSWKIDPENESIASPAIEEEKTSVVEEPKVNVSTSPTLSSDTWATSRTVSNQQTPHGLGVPNSVIRQPKDISEKLERMSLTEKTRKPEKLRSLSAPLFKPVDLKNSINHHYSRTTDSSITNPTPSVEQIKEAKTTQGNIRNLKNLYHIIDDGTEKSNADFDANKITAVADEAELHPKDSCRVKMPDERGSTEKATEIKDPSNDITIEINITCNDDDICEKDTSDINDKAFGSQKSKSGTTIGHNDVSDEIDSCQVSNQSISCSQISNPSEASNQVSNSSKAISQVFNSSKAISQVSNSSKASSQVSNPSKASNQLSNHSKASSQVSNHSMTSSQAPNLSKASSRVSSHFKDSIPNFDPTNTDKKYVAHSEETNTSLNKEARTNRSHKWIKARRRETPILLLNHTRISLSSSPARQTSVAKSETTKKTERHKDKFSRKSGPISCDSKSSNASVARSYSTLLNVDTSETLKTQLKRFMCSRGVTIDDSSGLQPGKSTRKIFCERNNTHLEKLPTFKRQSVNTELTSEDNKWILGTKSPENRRHKSSYSVRPIHSRGSRKKNGLTGGGRLNSRPSRCNSSFLSK